VDEIGDVSDRRRWEATNPALGNRLNVSVIEAELKLLSKDGFARERLGWWPTSKIEAVIKEKEWQAIKTDQPPTEGKLAYGVKFAPDGSAVALAVALKTADGRTHIEVVGHKSLASGTSWLVEWLSERWRKASTIVIDGLNGAAALSEALIDNGVSKKAVTMPKTSDVIAASTMLLNAIREKTVTHYGQPALDICATNAVRRNIGNNGGWGFGGGGDIDVSPLEAVALAHYGVLTSKRDPARKQRLL
jgi:phage terminase large subunit-like protein